MARLLKKKRKAGESEGKPKGGRRLLRKRRDGDEPKEKSSGRLAFLKRRRKGQEPDAGAPIPQPPKRKARTSARERVERRRRMLAAGGMVLASAAVVGSLFGPWYHYVSPENHEFNAKGWVTFTNLDIHLAITAGLIAILAIYLMTRRDERAGAAITALATVAVAIVAYRLIDRPYAYNFKSVTPHVGAVVTLLAGIAWIGISLRFHSYGRQVADWVARGSGPAMRRCPSCGERVLAKSSQCRHCGHAFEVKSSPPVKAT